MMLILTAWLALQGAEAAVAAADLADAAALDARQCAAIGALAEEAGRLEAGFAERVTPARKELEAAMAALEAELMRCGHADAARARVAGLKAKTDAMEAEHLASLKALERRLGALVTPAQRRILVGSPPRDEVDDHLENLRNLPDAAFARVVEPLFDLVFEQHEPWRDMSEEDRCSERVRLRKLLERARAMGDLDFELAKADLAAELVEPRPEPPAPKSLTRPGRILLHPRAAALLKARGEATPCGKCAKPRRETLSGKKPEFDELAEWLELDAAQREPVRASFGRLQAEFIGLLSGPDGKGRIPLVEMFRAGMEGGGEAGFLEVMSAPIPGKRETYLQRAMVLKARLDGELRKALSKAQFARYSGADLDVFGIKIGDLRPY